MKKLEKGFTLIELMIVVAIIAILAAVAAPRFGQQLQKAQDAKAVQILGAWRGGLNVHYTDGGVYAVNFGELSNSVDTGTKTKTYGSASAGSALAATATTAYTNAGKTDLTASKFALFGFTGSSTDQAISFDSTNGTDTKGTSWASF